MPRILMGVTPAQGHLAPMLTVLGALVARGDEVVVLTGSCGRPCAGF
jgi:UDP:flavonoid glycosyltransferase YjiC (YdhE family)